MNSGTDDVMFIVWERRGRLAADVKTALVGIPAKVVVVDDETEFRETLAESRSTVAILGRATVGEWLPDAIVAADLSHSRIIVVGTANADEMRRDLDLGAHLLIQESPVGFQWSATIRRLAKASQNDVRTARAFSRHRR